MKKIIYVFVRVICVLVLIMVTLYLVLVTPYLFSLVKEKVMPKKHILTSGNIIYVGNRYYDFTLYNLDLASNKGKGPKGREEFYVIKGGGSGSPETISKMDSENLLLDVYNNANHKIYRFNIKTKKMTYLREGSHPVYMPAHKKLLFLLNQGWNYNGERARGLFVADMDDLTKTKFIMETETQFNLIIPISDSEVIFQGERGYDWFIYDVKANKVKPLPIKDFYPHLWRDKTKQLLGRSKGRKKIYLISLDGKRVEKTSLLDYPIIYIPEKDAVIFIKRSRHLGIRAMICYDLYVYDFTTGKSELLNNGRENGFDLEKGVFVQYVPNG